MNLKETEAEKKEPSHTASAIFKRNREEDEDKEEGKEGDEGMSRARSFPFVSHTLNNNTPEDEDGAPMMR